ncbi:MAG TPA: pyridoxal phosphate-dependent aminotransferase, partial [Methanocorpusculum sp.]|nr:pyridoxal phosphate-dependent aminotransferase [Methanocorpusculum sp.]
MRNFVSDIAASIPPSGIRKFFDLVLTMDSDEVISLGVGEPDFDTPYA